MKLTNQQKGSLLAFTAVFLITPDSLFIRLSNIDTWGLLFYRGAIPFVTVLLGMLLIYRMTFFNLLFSTSLCIFTIISESISPHADFSVILRAVTTYNKCPPV